MQNDVQNLLQKEMDRKDFLKHVGIGFAAILGFTTILKTLSTLSTSGQKKQTVGYSSGAYGGGRSSTSTKQG